MVKDMVMVSIYLLMEINILENGKKEISKEKVYWNMLLALSMMDNGKMISQVAMV